MRGPAMSFLAQDLIVNFAEFATLADNRFAILRYRRSKISLSIEYRSTVRAQFVVLDLWHTIGELLRVERNLLLRASWGSGNQLRPFGSCTLDLPIVLPTYQNGLVHKNRTNLNTCKYRLPNRLIRRTGFDVLALESQVLCRPG